MNNVSNHYDEEYFKWQTTVGQFGGWANLSKFDEFIHSENTVLDFGCGGGWLLKKVTCKQKLGIEVNPAAAQTAKKNGIDVHFSIDDIPDNSIDVIISNHALEHTLNPLQELRSLLAKLKSDGTVVFVVPCESINNKYSPKDINHHLYTWNPMCLGNLFTEAGFKVIKSTPYLYSWSPKFAFVAKIGGRRMFNFVSLVFGLLKKNYSQVRIVATKE